jgi:hypothetical protein
MFFAHKTPFVYVPFLLNNFPAYFQHRLANAYCQAVSISPLMAEKELFYYDLLQLILQEL